jgi:hypothetical protein
VAVWALAKDALAARIANTSNASNRGFVVLFFISGFCLQADTKMVRRIERRREVAIGDGAALLVPDCKAPVLLEVN